MTRFADELFDDLMREHGAALAGLTAFVVPSRFVAARVPGVEALFAPVSRPAGAIARWLHGSFAAPELSDDKRSEDVVKRENEALKNEIANLYSRLAELEKLESDRSAVGDIRSLCTPFTVASTDSGARASLGPGLACLWAFGPRSCPSTA